MTPILSAVIPTRNRPDLVLRAVRSALAQTIQDLEVVVVIDGPDPITEAAISSIGDTRICIVGLQDPVGGAEARNRGVQAASAEWVAFLDDDDEWMPEKAEKQLMKATASSHQYPIISCKLIARTPKADLIWPRVEPYLPVGDYLMRRRSFSKGEGVLQTSTLMARRELLCRCPFTNGLRKHQDWDWIIRAMEVSGTGIEFLSEVLTIWYFDEPRPGIGAWNNWKYSLDWVNGIRGLISGEAYAGFLLTSLGSSAAAKKEWCAFLPLLMGAFTRGNPRLIHLALFFAKWVAPLSIMRAVSGLVRRAGCV